MFAFIASFGDIYVLTRTYTCYHTRETSAYGSTLSVRPLRFFHCVFCWLYFSLFLACVTVGSMTASLRSDMIRLHDGDFPTVLMCHESAAICRLSAYKCAIVSPQSVSST